MGSPTHRPGGPVQLHSSFDELFARVTETAALGSDGPFVINLSSSSVPISLPPNGITVAANTRVYQIRCIEDRRLRYRLRLGPFLTEFQANAVLGIVRDNYPGALTATANAEDLESVADLQLDALAAAATPAPALQPPPVAPPLLTASMAVDMPGKGAATMASPGASQEAPPLALENTQTLRPLTTPELAAEQALRWFVIELAVAGRSFDPDAVPNLDIFGVYRLYTVEASDQGRTIHALRLGFFSEAAAAQAVADYLQDHYAKPLVKRVSVAERERFKQCRLEARKTVEATGRHAVIEITDERYVRQRRLST